MSTCLICSDPLGDYFCTLDCCKVELHDTCFAKWLTCCFDAEKCPHCRVANPICSSHGHDHRKEFYAYLVECYKSELLVHKQNAQELRDTILALETERNDRLDNVFRLTRGVFFSEMQ